LVLAQGTVVLLEDKIAYRVYEGSNALGLANAFFAAELTKYASKGFLLEVFDDVRGQVTGTQFDPQKLAKIADKVLFRRGFAITEPLNVLTVK